MKGILDRSFRYRPSFATDLRKTFARARREQRAAATAHAALQTAASRESRARSRSA
jgi:hypothetical protein